MHRNLWRQFEVTFGGEILCTDCTEVWQCTDCIEVWQCTDCIEVWQCTDCIEVWQCTLLNS